MSPTPNWYANPTDPTQEIYWDGVRWSGQSRPAAVRIDPARAPDRGTSFEQFLNILGNTSARLNVGIDMSTAYADQLRSDASAARAYYLAWLEKPRTVNADGPNPVSTPVGTSLSPGWYDDGSGRQRLWTGTTWSNSNAAQTPSFVPGRVPGFALGLIAALFTTIPIVCLPLGIVGWVQSAKALRVLVPGRQGRGLAVAGLVLSIAALALTTLLMIMAIPGAIQHNFGS